MAQHIEKPDDGHLVIPTSACITVVDGCIVHGDEPLTDEGRAAVSALIAAARQRLSQES